MAKQPVDWSFAATAYDAGRANLLGSDPLAVGNQMFWILPWVVGRVRAPGIAIPEPPVASDLDNLEKLCCARLYYAIATTSVLLKGRERDYYESETATYAYHPVSQAVFYNERFDRSDLAAARPVLLSVTERLAPLCSALWGLTKERRDERLRAAKKIPPIDGPLGSPEVTDWLARYPDPDFWHLMLAPGALNYDLASVISTLHWIIAHPDCDRASAASLYIACRGNSVVGKPVTDMLEGRPSQRLATRILLRSEGPGFAHSRYNLSSLGLADDQLSVLEEARMIAVSEGCVPRPERLLGTAFVGRAAETASGTDMDSWITRGG